MSTPARRACSREPRGSVDPPAMHAAGRGTFGGLSLSRGLADDLALMRRIDELYLAMPFLGSRRMVGGCAAGTPGQPQAGAAADAPDGYAGLGPSPGTSKAAPGHKIFPYLLRDVTIERPNHVWAADITYIPIGAGLPLPGGGHRLGEPGGPGMAAVEHDGHVVLRRGARGGAGALRQAGDLQHRPGRAVHQRGLHRHAGRRRDRASRWTDAAAGWTTSSSSGCGAR